MSSEVDAGVVILAPVLGVAYAAGWIAWQGGRLLVEANREADRQIAENRRKEQEAQKHRKMSALAAHRQLVDMCSQIISQLDSASAAGSTAGFAEIEQMKYDLKKICDQSVPDDAEQIEMLTSTGYMKLDRIVRQQRQIAALQLDTTDSGLYRGLSVADLMEDLRIAISAMDIITTVGIDVKAADPAVLERAKLNKAFMDVANQIMVALADIGDLARTCNISKSGSVWFHSCFNGVDDLIETLCRPTTSNKELKKGIKRLEECMQRYDMMAESIEKEARKMLALYDVYASTAKALCEEVLSIKAFKSSEEIEERLRYLQTRAQRAQTCAEIYKKLGSTGYLCYALDTELRVMGYEVHSREIIKEMAKIKPDYAVLGNTKLPFYKWSKEDLTQLYSLTSECALQLIVHDDGTVSMQTIADEDNDTVVSAQRKHCKQLKLLHERLRNNWFISCDYKETKSPDKVKTVAAWRASRDYAWRVAVRRSIDEERGKEKPIAATAGTDDGGRK